MLGSASIWSEGMLGREFYRLGFLRGLFALSNSPDQRAAGRLNPFQALGLWAKPTLARCCVKWKIRVTFCTLGAIVPIAHGSLRIEGPIVFESLGQIGIGNVGSTKGDQVG